MQNIKEWLCALFLLELFIAPLHSTEENSTYNEKFLCVDVGGSRIKAAILHRGISLEELKSVKVEVFPSEGWLDEKFPSFFDPVRLAGLSRELAQPYSKIAFGITGPVLDGKFYVDLDKQKPIPLCLKNACEHVSGRPVFVENDAVIWGRGAVYWESLVGQRIEYPCVGVAFGTGIGIVLMYSPDIFMNIEITAFPSRFRRLQENVKDQPPTNRLGKPFPHYCIGEPFFIWMEETHLILGEKVLKNIFHQRVTFFLRDLIDFIEGEFEIPIQTMILGGGNSRYISKERLQEEIDKTLILLSPDNVLDKGIDNDLIPLLGCLEIPYKTPAKVFPAWEDLNVEKPKK